MQIPNLSNLKNQSFTSNLIEFVWHFPDEKFQGEFLDEFIFQFHKNAKIYMVTCRTTKYGDDITTPLEFRVDANLKSLESVLTDEQLWTDKKYPLVYNKFSNGKDLIQLAKDVSEFLNK